VRGLPIPAQSARGVGVMERNERTSAPLEAVFRHVWAISYDLPGTEDTALFDETNSALVLINGVGAAIWELIDGKRSVVEIVNFIVDVRGNSDSRGRIERDVTAFLGQMLERGSIERMY
jgi:Coenzyme PQQ synthesis protein D (PqqD)